MLILGFILKLCNDHGYFNSFSKQGTYLGLIGLILWSFAYSQRKSKNKTK